MKLRSGVGASAPGHPSTAYGRLPLIEGESHASSSATMTVPYYISEDKSDMRGIKRGWYAMEDDGGLASGPFSSHEVMRQQNHSADERDDGVQVATRAELKHVSADIRR